MIKAVFFDIDWTLLSHSQGKIPDSAVKAIKQLQKNGIKCVAATGRNTYEFQFLNLNGVNFDGQIVINGQIIKDENDKIIKKRSVVDPSPIVREFNKCELPLMIIEENRAYINFVNDIVVESMKTISTPVPPIEKYKGGEIYQGVLYIDESQEEQELPKYPGFHFLRWHSNGIDITIENVDKVLGIKDYCEIYDVKQSETMSFGDAGNDVSMIEWTEIGVAMGNACPEAKNVADYITKDIDDDGIAYALKHFKLI